MGLKTIEMALPVGKLSLTVSYNRFDRIPALDRQTDRNGISISSSASSIVRADAR